MIALYIFLFAYVTPAILDLLISYLWWLYRSNPLEKTIGDYVDYYEKEIDSNLSIIAFSIIPGINIFMFSCFLFIGLAGIMSIIVDGIDWKINKMRNFKIKK